MFYVNGFKATAGVAGSLGDTAASYEVVTPEDGDNPSEQGWYVLSEGAYVLTEDTTVQDGTTYYALATAGTGTESGTGSGSGTGTTVTVSGTNVHTTVGLEVDASQQDASTGVFLTRVKLADGSGIKVGDEVVISYCYKEDASTIQVDNQQTFVGEAILRWPVYSSGEEIKAAGVKGYCYMHIYKCRCTAMPGFDTSYKSAVTNGITLSAMDPHRNDGAIYSISFVEK